MVILKSRFKARSNVFMLEYLLFLFTVRFGSRNSVLSVLSVALASAVARRRGGAYDRSAQQSQMTRALD